MPLVPALFVSLIIAVLVSLFGASPTTSAPDNDQVSAGNDHHLDQDRG